VIRFDAAVLDQCLGDADHHLGIVGVAHRVVQHVLHELLGQPVLGQNEPVRNALERRGERISDGEPKQAAGEPIGEYLGIHVATLRVVCG